MHRVESANIHRVESANMHHGGTYTPDQGLVGAPTGTQLLHPLPCLLTPPLGTADLTIEGDAFTVEAKAHEALSTLLAAYASFLHCPLVVH